MSIFLGMNWINQYVQQNIQVRLFKVNDNPQN